MGLFSYFLGIVSFKKIKSIWFYFSIALIFFVLIITSYANSDLTVGRFALFMDERIIYDGVEKILHPTGFKNFLWAIFDGDDHRYGRILWNVSAFFAFIPEILFEGAGQIYSTRMTQVIILISAFILLSLTFIKHWFFRFVLLASLFAMPFTNYYMTMPKPEPLQMLFLSVFLYYFNKTSMKMGNPVWIFIGIAFGVKISILPVIFIFLFFACIKYSYNHNIKNLPYHIIKTIGYILIGLAIAIPILAPNIILSFLIYKVMDKLILDMGKKYRWLVSGLIIVLIIMLNFFVSFILYNNHVSTGLFKWGVSTILNTGHGADAIDIGFVDWSLYFIYDWMQTPIFISLLFIGVCSFLITFQLIQVFDDIKSNNYTRYFLPIILAYSGLALNLLIFIGVHRLWGLYLFLGSVLILVGIVSISENMIMTKLVGKKSWIQLVSATLYD
jgi:hypothetical protein